MTKKGRKKFFTAATVVKRYDAESVLEALCWYFDITQEQILKKKPNGCRQQKRMLLYILRFYAFDSMYKVSAYMGYRKGDVSGVLKSLNRFRAEMEENSSLRQDVNGILGILDKKENYDISN